MEEVQDINNSGNNGSNTNVNTGYNPLIPSTPQSNEDKRTKILKYALTTLVVFIFIIIMFIMIRIMLGSNNSEGECSDISCVIDSVNNGKSAKIKLTRTINVMEAKQISKNEINFDRCPADSCTMKLVYLDIYGEYPFWTPPNEIEEWKQVYQELKGKSGSCKFSKTNLISLLEKWHQGLFESDDFSSGECSGEYFSMI
jgi:hypothetical protein